MTAAKLSPQAERELFAAVRWISADSPRAAKSLRTSVTALLARIAAFPESGALRLDLTDRPWRFFEVRGFPYMLIVEADSRPPVVLHVVHTSREVRSLLGPF